MVDKGTTPQGWLAADKDELQTTPPVSNAPEGWLKADKDELHTDATARYSPTTGHYSDEFGKSQYDDRNLDPKYIMNNEFQYMRGEAQSTLDKAGNGVVRAATKIVPRTIEGIVNPFYGSIAALTATDKDGKWDPDASKFWDNALTNGANAMSKDLDKSLPLYDTRASEQAQGFEKLLYANTLWGDVLDGMSYSASALLSGNLMTRGAALLGKMSAIGKAEEYVSKLKSIDNAADAAKYISQVENTMYTIKDGVQKGAITFVGASTEAADNALSDSKEWYAKMEYNLTHDEVGNKTRNLTDGEKEWLDMNRKELGNSSFAMNVPVIMADNWLTFGKAMLSKKSAEKALFKDVADKSVYDVATDTYTHATKSTIDKILDRTYGIRSLAKPAIVEGLQEVEQLGVTKGTQDYYTKKYYNPDSASFLDSFGEGFSAAMSKEGLESFLIGAISSGIFGNGVKLATEGISGYSNPEDITTAQAIQYLNDNKSKPAFKTMVDAFHRHGNLANEQDQALKDKNDFEYMNKASDMMINHITSKIKTGKVDDLKKQLNSFSQMSPEEFEASYGIKMSNNELTGMKQSMSEFIRPKLATVAKIEKLHESLENMFPEAPEGIKDRLLYTAFSLDNSIDRANELSTKVQKTLQDNQLRYGNNVLVNGALIPTNYFKLPADQRAEFLKAIEASDISPLDKEQILADIKDIDKLDQRRQEFIKDYKTLSDPKIQAELAKKDAEAAAEIKKAVDEQVQKIKEKQDSEKAMHVTIAKATNVKELDKITEQADKAGIMTPELLDRIIRRKEALTPKEQTRDTAVEGIVDETIVETPNTIELESKKPTTENKTNNGTDDGTKEAETRAYRVHEKIVLDGHRLLVVTRNNNSELFDQILELDPTGKQFEEDFYSGKADKKAYLNGRVTSGHYYNGIYTVLVDKDNKMVLADQDGNITPDGKIVFHTLETEGRIEGNEIIVTDKGEAIDNISKLRGDLLKLKTKDVYLPIIDKSKGIPEMLPKKDAAFFDANGEFVEYKKRQSIPVTESITGSIEDIKVELPVQGKEHMPSSATLSNGQVALTGKLYVFDKNNTAFDLVPRTVNGEEADMILNLIAQKFGIAEKMTASPVTQIEKIISMLIPKKGPNEFTMGFKDGILYLGTDTKIGSQDFAKPEVQSAIREFLTTKKYVNANVNKKNGYDLEARFTAPTIDDKIPGKTYNKYKEYLLSGEEPMFGTDLAPSGGVQYRNVYLKYQATIQTNVIGETNPISNSNGDIVVESMDLSDEPSNAAKDLNTESKKRDFYKKDIDEEETLDRTVEAAKTAKTRITDYEIKWFKDKFPNIPIDLVQGLIENKSFGRFLSSAKILLSDRATTGTLHHEAFHAVTQLYLSQKEIDALYNEARVTLNLNNATDLEVEEKLAEDFAVYKETGKVLSGAPKRNTIFRRILDAIKRFAGLSATSVEEIYNRLDKGYYTNKDIKGVRQFTQLDSVAIPNLTVSQTKDLYSGMDAIFFDIVFKDNKTPIEALSKTDKVLQFIYKRLVKKEEEVTASGNTELIKVYSSVLDNWPTVMKGWSDRMKSLGVDVKQESELGDRIEAEDIDDENKVSEDGVRSGDAYKAANEESTKKTMFKATKMIIRSLKQKNSDGSDKINDLGLPQTVDYNSTYNYLLKQTVGLLDYADIYSKIEELSKIKPEFKDLLVRLKPATANLSLEQINFQEQFRQDFSKNLSNIFITVIEDDGTIKQVNANKQGIQDRTKEKWKSKLKTIAKTTADNRLIIEPVKTSDDVVYLRALGIEFSPETLPELRDNKEFTDASTAIRNYVIKHKGDVSELFGASTKDKENEIAGRIGYLLDIESNHSTSITELSTMSTSNKSVYPISLNNGLSTIKNLINNAKDLEALYKELPNLNKTSVKGSVWLTALFDENGVKRPGYKIELNLADGLKTGTSIKDGVANSTKDLSPADKFVQEMNHLLITGNSSVIRTSDKATEHIIGLNKVEGNQKLIIPIKDLELDPENPDLTGFNNEKVKSIFRGYFRSELERIAEFELYENMGKQIEDYNKSGDQWTIFQKFPFFKGIKDVVKDKIKVLKVSIKEGMSPLEVEHQLDELAEVLAPQIDISTVEFFKDYARELTNDLREYKVIDTASTEQDVTFEAIPRGFSKELTEEFPVDQLIRAVVVNDFINSVEQTKLFFGNQAYYKALFKRTSSLAGTKETASTDQHLNDWLNNNNKRKDTKLADGKVRVVIFEDSTQHKLNLGEYKKALVASGYTESEADKLLKAYKKMDEGDAQGWITLDEYREFSFRLGQWGTKMDQIWDKAQSYEKDKPETHLSADEIKYFFKVLKAQMAGPIVDSKLFIPGYHKFSLMPLIPQLVDGKNMSKVLSNMTRQQVGYALFKSGSKVGTPLVEDIDEKDKPVGRANRFYTEDSIVAGKKRFGTQGEVNEGDYNVQTVNYRFLGLQTKTSDPKDKVTFGTQFRKLLFAGAFSNGKERFLGAEEMYKKYTGIIDGMVKDAKSALIKELGLDPDNDYKAKDVTKLVDLLRKESEERDLPDNIIDALQTSKNEAEEIVLKYPLDAFVNKAKIDSMLTNLINSRLVRQKVNGDAYIQGASSGFEKLGVRKAGENDTLKFYEQVKDKDGNIIHTSKAEVMIPMSKQYQPLLDKYEGSIEKLNQAIRENKIDEKVLTLIAYRIPTQGLNSIDHLVIKEFLVPSAGQLIILPTSIVAKSGGDYDIDKMNVFRPDLTKDGEYDMTSSNNSIIDIASTVLSNPHNFIPLITPNSTGILTNMVDEYKYELYKAKGGTNTKEELEGQEDKNAKDFDFTRQLMITEKIIKQFTKLMSAKGGIGPSAISNVFIALAQRVGLVLNTTYQGSDFKKHTVSINFPHNLQGDNINISDTKDALGKNDIQEVNSQIINAYVDAANSPELLPGLNMDMDTTLPVYLYLNTVGVPFEFSFYMMKQPIIQKYIKEFSINNSAFLAAQGLKKNVKDLRTTVMNEYANKITTAIADKQFTDTEELKKFSVYDNSKNTNRTEESDNEFYNIQVQIFEDFIKYTDQAQLLSNAIRSVNHDTSGLPANLETVHLKLEAIEKVKNDNFVIGLEKVLTETPIGSFDQNQFALDAYRQFYATQDKDVVKGFKNLMNVIKPSKGEDKARIATMITNDFISYVTQNYGYTSIDTLRQRLFEGNNSVAKRILKIQSNPSAINKKLADNILIKELQPMIANDRTSDLRDNVRLFTKRFDTFTANQLTEAFREIKESDLELYKDIVDLGIIQSGLTNSPITFVGIIPFEYYGDLFNKAFEGFNKSNKTEAINKFGELFLRNNMRDSLIWKLNLEEAGYTPLGQGIYGKDYSQLSVGKIDNFEIGSEDFEGNPDLGDLDDTILNSENEQSVESRLKASRAIGQHNGELYIKQHSYPEAIKAIGAINKETPGLVTIKRLNHFGQQGRQIWKVVINSQLGLQFNKSDDSLKDKELRSKYFPTGATKAMTILDKIAESSHPLNKLAKRLGNYAKLNNVTIILDAENGYKNNPNNPNFEANAYYDVDNNEIHIAEGSNFRGGKVEATILHEILHSVTYNKLRDNSEVRNDFNKLYNYAVEKLGKDSDYGLTNLDEFMVGIFTSSRLIDKLKEIPPSKDIKKYKNLMQEIFDYILKLLNITQVSNLYEQAFSIATNILEDYKDQNESFNEVSQMYAEDNKLFSENEPSKVNPFSVQQQFLKNKIFRLERELRKYPEGSNEHYKALSELASEKLKVEATLGASSEDLYREFGEEALKSVEELLEELKSGTAHNQKMTMTYAKNIISAWQEFDGLQKKANDLERELHPFIENLYVEKANEYTTRKKVIDQDDINDQTRDIGKIELWVGALADSDNIIASTIGTMIIRAHNRIFTKNKEINFKIQEEIDKLVAYSKKNGVKVDDMYNVFIQEHNGTTVLTKEYLGDGSINPNWTKIQETPELLDFYNFYQNTITNLQKNVPSFKGSGKYFIPNVKDKNIKEKLKDLIPLKERSTTFTKGEEVRADVVPLEMHKPISAVEKTKNLGQALSDFAGFANNYSEMSEILPEVRLLQEGIAYIRDPETGIISHRQFTKPSDPSKSVNGEDSNIYKMVKEVINMQVKGDMKNNEWKPKYGKAIVDMEGTVIGEKYADISGLIDKLLSYNSMLRIGLSPVTALANVAYGDITNIIEAIGGRFMTLRGLAQASNIFAAQTFVKDSVMNKLLVHLNPLQNLDDYDYSEGIKSAGKANKLTPEQIKDIMYLPQKKGELWLQARTMIAVMIKDKLMNSKGELTPEYNKLSEKQLEQLSDKIQRLNQVIHGRYTSKEAATLQQSVLYRTFIQFRKWIPSAVENRIGKKKWDNRLQAEMEGRYRTWGRLISNLNDTIARVKKGNLTELEIYNIKKGLTELVIWAAIAIAYAGLHGDDDKDKKFRKQLWVKTSLTLLSRTAGDIEFFYNPGSLARVTTVPLVKTLEDVRKTVMLIPTVFEHGEKKDWMVTRGRNKGKSKFRAQLPKIIIGANPFNQVMDLLSEDELPKH